MEIINKQSSGPIYEIIVTGQISPAWSVWFDGMQLENLPEGRVRISGSLADQSALHGLLERIRDLNLELLAVRKT
jgi:hypothetical protein